MQQYVSRRRRCWKLLTELDPQIFLSEGHRADMLLDLAGLDRQQRTMIQASIGNARNFDKISDALIVQQPRIHTNEYKGRMVLRGDKPSGKGYKGKSKGKSKGKGKRGYPRHHRNPSGFAYHATEEDFACGYTAAEDDSEPYANPAYVDDEDYSGDDAEAYNAYDEDYDDYDEDYEAYDNTDDGVGY